MCKHLELKILVCMGAHGHGDTLCGDPCPIGREALTQ